MNGAPTGFLIALSALFSIINPIGGAIIFSQVTGERSHGERMLLARKIGFYSALVMLGARWFGAFVLSFFGVSLSALRIAGGLVVASYAWTLLHAPERREEAKQEQAQEAAGLDEVAFFPLTMPFTTGPGTISVAVAIGSNVPAGAAGYLALLGASTAAIVIAVLIWLLYGWADRVVAAMGPTAIRVVTRLAAFLLLCVGTQITLSGVTDFIRDLGP